MSSTNRPSSSSSDPPSPFDDLADLFLGEVDEVDLERRSAPPPAIVPGSVAPDRWAGPRAAAREPTPRPVELEVLIVGHLPVMAGPWVDQAAGVMAAEARPVLLLRDRDGAVTVDLFNPARSLGDSTQKALQSFSENEAGSLRDVHLRMQGLDPRWILRLPDGGRLADLEGIPIRSVTVLTGSDQAATVATYRLFKQILPDLDPETMLGVIVVGSSSTDAEMAAARIRDASAEHLGRPVRLVASIPRMTPMAGHSVGRFSPVGEPLEWVVRSLLHGPLASPVTEDQTDEPADREEPTQPANDLRAPEIRLGPHLRLTRDDDVREEDRPAAIGDPSIEPEIRTGVETEQGIEPELPRHESIGESEAKSVRQSVSHSEASTATDKTDPLRRLSDFVDDLVRVDVTCPRSPEVEISVARDGQLHLLALDSSERSVTSLLVARDWAKEHLEILQQVCPFIRQAPNDEVTLHLFTSTPKERSHFISGSWRIHLLMPGPGHEKEATPSEGWLHVELN